MNNIEELLIEIRDILIIMSAQKKARKTRSKLDADGLYTPGFESAWQTYPRKLGKRNAAKAYSDALSRLKQSRPEISSPESYILKGVFAYSKVCPVSRIREEAKHCLHMSTFLNQDRFEDDPDAWGKEDSNEGIGGPAWEPTVD